MNFADLSEDELITIGSFCQTVKQSHAWLILTDTFEQQTFQHMMTTEPHELKKRESIYASFSGVRDFITHMDAFIAAKDKLTAQPLPPEDEPMPIDLED